MKIRLFLVSTTALLGIWMAAAWLAPVTSPSASPESNTSASAPDAKETEELLTPISSSVSAER
ncbi:MAG: hypothetical protein ACPG6P_14155 [Akkermansiaceae bacterium]